MLSCSTIFMEVLPTELEALPFDTYTIAVLVKAIFVKHHGPVIVNNTL